MPVHCEKRGSKYRIVESGGNIAKNKSGTPLDGGGHSSDKGCKRQARAINMSLHKKGKI